MVSALAVIAVEQFACFSSSLDAGVAECSELLYPKVVVIGIGGGRADVDVEDWDVVTALSDIEARDLDRVDNILDC